MVEIKDTYNFNRSLRGAGIKSLKLHPGDALGLETVLMTRRKEVWGGGGRVHVITKPALHFSLSTWKHSSSIRWFSWVIVVIEVNAFHVLFRIFWKSFHGPQLHLVNLKFSYFFGSCLLQAHLCRLAPPLPVTSGLQPDSRPLIAACCSLSHPPWW